VSLLKGNNGRDFSQDGHTAQRGIFLLYLLNSLCQSLEEEPLIRDGIDYRLRLLREIS
jgi:hypothetical protein